MFNHFTNYYIRKTQKYLRQKMAPCASEESMTIAAFRKLYERYRLSDFLTYRYIDEQGVYLADNPFGVDSYLIGFAINPINYANEKTVHQLQTLLSYLPTGTIVYSVVLANSAIQNHLLAWAQTRQHTDNAFYNSLTERRCDYMANWAQGKICPLPGEHFKPRNLNYYWFIKVSIASAGISAKYIMALHEKATAISNKVLAIFNVIGVLPQKLSGTELLRTIKLIANFHEDPNIIKNAPIYPEMPVAQQVLARDTTVSIENSGEIILKSVPTQAERYLRIFTVAEYPDEPFYLKQMPNCLGDAQKAMRYIPGEFYAFTILEALDAETIKQKALAKMALLQQQTANSTRWYQSLMKHLYQRANNIENLYTAISKEGERPIKAIAGIVLAAPYRTQLEEATSIAKSAWEQAQLRLYQESAIALPIWLTSLPGQYTPERDGDTKGLQRGTTMTALNAANLLHIQGDWPGTAPQQGGLLLLSRRGALTCLNVFESLTNYNGIMVAASGSGKSFTTNELAADFLARGGLVRIIDAGRSYFNTAEINSGQNLVFKKGQGMCINPFSVIHTADDLREELEILVMLVAQMAFPFGFGQHDSKELAKTYEYRVIEEAISTLWPQLGTDMSIRDIAIWFAAQPESRLKDIARQLRPWAYGRYAEWLVGKANITFSNPFIVLELDDLAQEQELQTIVLNLVLAKVQREMYLVSAQEIQQYGHKLPKLLIIDEAWNLLNKQYTSFFIESAYRRARKYAASIWLITQSFFDFEQNVASRVALDNANWVIALMQDPGSVQRAVEKGLIDWSPNALQQINTLQKTKNYSELYVMSKSNRQEGLYRLAVDPLAYWAYSTTSAEREKLAQLQAKGLSLQAAIVELAQHAR